MRFYKLVFSLLVILSSFGLAQAEEGSIKAGSTAPSFSLENVDKTPIQLKSFLGKKVLLHFWAPTCFVCPQEFETLNKMQKHFGSSLSQVVTVVSFDNSKKSLKSIAEMQSELPIALDTTNSVAEMYDVKMLPVTFAIDEQGKFVEINDPENPSVKSFQFLGPRDWSSESGIESLRQAGFIR